MATTNCRKIRYSVPILIAQPTRDEWATCDISGEGFHEGFNLEMVGAAGDIHGAEDEGFAGG